jgi:hypothetical protein
MHYTKQFLVLTYRGPGEQRDEDWDAFFEAINASGRLVGGSALGDRSGCSAAGPVPVQAPDVVGYFVFKANDASEICPLLARCPILLSGGTADVIELILG